MNARRKLGNSRQELAALQDQVRRFHGDRKADMVGQIEKLENQIPELEKEVFEEHFQQFWVAHEKYFPGKTREEVKQQLLQMVGFFDQKWPVFELVIKRFNFVLSNSYASAGYPKGKTDTGFREWLQERMGEHER